MISGARYVHTNLIARDWQALAGFYQAHFGCVPVLPERNYAGCDLEAGTGVPGASLCGVHLRLPGVDAKGPTLEIFTYSRLADGAAPAANRPGFAHIAFEVTSVRAARDEIIGAGGQAVGRCCRARNRDRRPSDVVLCNGPGREYHRATILVSRPGLTQS
jgi:catechol 2,3-dioxygenase-like lactoylglutathione lyase family enzyme